MIKVGQQIEVEVAERDPRGKLNLYAVVDGVVETCKSGQKSEEKSYDKHDNNKQEANKHDANDRRTRKIEKEMSTSSAHSYTNLIKTKLL